MASIFETLLPIKVDSYIEKKNGLNYLSWANAWRELKKIYPGATYEVIHNPEGLNYHTDGRTCWVEVTVRIDDEEQTESLAVMDFRNAAIPFDKVTSVDVNKSIKRCLAKCIGLFGLGISLYAGEDLPEEAAPKDEVTSAKTAPKAEKAVPKYLCTECGKQITPVTYNGEDYGVMRINNMSTKHFGKPMCWECMQKAAAEKKGEQKDAE